MAESELLQDFPMQWALDRQLIANEHYRLGVNWFKLATNSAFFQEKLRDIPRDDPLILSCYDLSMLNTAVYFCHMGVSDVDLNEDTLEHNALVATDYEIKELRKFCCDFVKATLTEDNVWSMWRATKRACKEIKQIVFDFILRNFLTVSLKHEFVELSVEELRDFLIDDYLNITETQLMETLDRWVSHAPKRRTHHFDTLFSRVRLGNLSIEQLESLNHSPFIRKARSSGSLRALHQVKRNILRTRKNLRPLDNILLGSYQPRIPHDSIFIFGGYEQGTDVTRTVQVFDSRRNTWITHSEYQTDASSICLPKPRMSFGIVIIENCIYLVGGEYAEGKATQEVMAYDLKQQTWNRRAPMHEVRRDLSAVVVGNYLYAIGGDNNNNVLKSVERYCAQMNQWTERSSMHLRRAAAAATVLNDIIFVCGGYTELYMEAVSNSCESYNPQTDQWSYINPMTEMRSYIQVSENSNHFILFEEMLT